MKKILTTALVATVGLAGLTACASASPDAMCDVMADHYEQFDYAQVSSGVESVEQLNAIGAMLEGAYEEMAPVAPDEIASDVTSARTEARQMASLNTTELLTQGLTGNSMEFPAHNRVAEYLEANSKCSQEYLGEKLAS